jgi:hypothetical protein
MEGPRDTSHLGRHGQGELSGTAVLPQTTLGQISIAPWTDRPPAREKRETVISNKNKKDMWERGWGALSAEDWGKGVLPRTVNKQAGQVGAGACAQQPGAGKLVRVVEGGKLHRRGGRPTSHVSCKQTWWLAGAAAPPSNQEQKNL